MIETTPNREMYGFSVLFRVGFCSHRKFD